MQANPIEEWQRLTELYREMGDGELEALDADKADLTEVAQQVLRDEMRKRGLDKLNKPSGPSSEPNQAGSFGASRRLPREAIRRLSTHGRRRYASAKIRMRRGRYGKC
jgi:hypothetical protein